jgi:hypothetical protein
MRSGFVVLAVLPAACGGTVALAPDAADDAAVDSASEAGQDAGGPSDATVAPQDARDTGSPPEASDAGVDDSSFANADGCPSSFATSGGPCRSYGTTCRYPEGTCSCCPPAMGCFPLTCAQQGFGCGVVPDGCGGLLQCGSCTPPLTCGGGGTAFVCGDDAGSAPPPCKPKSCAEADAACGVADDGCGGQLDCSVFCGTWLCNTMCF